MENTPKILSFDTHPSSSLVKRLFKKFNQLEPINKLLITGMLLVLIAVPVVTSNTFDLRQRAASDAGLEFVDAHNTSLTQTISPVVKVELFSPWTINKSVGIASKKPDTETVTTSSITLSEEPTFSRYIQVVSPISSNPMYTYFKFSNTKTGEKILFVKYISSSGEEQIFSRKITLISPSESKSPSHP